jgi:hypothetical protein
LVDFINPDPSHPLNHKRMPPSEEWQNIRMPLEGWLLLGNLIMQSGDTFTRKCNDGRTFTLSRTEDGYRYEYQPTG